MPMVATQYIILVEYNSFKRIMTERYCYKFLIMYKAVLKSLGWQKEFYQIIVSVTDIVLTHIYMNSDLLTQK